MVDYLKFDESNTTTTMTTSYQYTALGQTKEIKYCNDTSSATMEKYTYTYDKRGNILTEYIYNTYGGTTSLTKSYVYNSMNMLTRTTVGTDITDYAYDATGNRYHEESRQTNDYYDKYYYYNEFDQLTTVTTNIDHGAVDTEHYTYNARGAISYSENKLYNRIIGTTQVVVDVDEFGNQIFETVYIYEYPQGTPWLGTVYTYDKSGMLQKTVVDLDVYTTETTGHFYNGMEQRVRKIQVSTTTKYIYAGSEMLFTTDGNNAKLTENILSINGQVIASQRFGSYTGYYFYNQDIRNSTMSIISDSYSAVKYYKYDEYGKITTLGSSSFINSETYTGSISEGSNIYYMNARFYNANTGRFLTQDTYKGNAYEPMSQNLYTYVGNNPINYIDPTGHNDVAVMQSFFQAFEYAPWQEAGQYYQQVSMADGPCPVLDTAGLLIFGGVVIGACVYATVDIVSNAITNDNFEVKDADEDIENDEEETETPIPSVPYPGDNPSQSPGDDWEWKVSGEPGSSTGNWYNPTTGESLHPDLNHQLPIGPHWDYKPFQGADWYRWFPNGDIIIK